MATPIPTPFDIIDPPPGPLIPSLTMWLMLVGLLVVARTVLWLFQRAKKPTPLGQHVRSLLHNLSTTANKAETPEQLQRVARLAKRILSAYLPFDPSSLSPSDLRDKAGSLTKSLDPLEQSTGSLLHLLADIEDLTYAPHTATELIRQRATQLLEATQTHVGRRLA
jgi:hypothetical protein